MTDPRFKIEKNLKGSTSSNGSNIFKNGIKLDIWKINHYFHFIEVLLGIWAHSKKLGKIQAIVSSEKIETSFVEMNNVSLDDINNAASRIYDPNNFILLVMGNQDSCTTFLDRFEDVEYYEQTEELR